MEHYDQEDVGPRKSPLLAPVQLRLKPEPLGWGSDDETNLKDAGIDRDAPGNGALRGRKRHREQDDNGQPSLHEKNRDTSTWKDGTPVHEMGTRHDWAVEADVPLPSIEVDELDQTPYQGDSEDDGTHAPRPTTRSLAVTPSVPPFTDFEFQSRDSTPRSITDTLAQGALRSRSRRKRFALPLLVARPSGAPIEVMACPDSGSDDNIISLELVNNLGLKPDQISSDEPRKFAVANGKIVRAVGQVSTSCKFAAGAPSDITNLECIFHVFSTLAVPLIMGVEFLQQTETLSKHRDRLVEQVVPAMQSLRVNSVGRPKRSLICRLDTYVGCATVDTGSDLDLVSPAFAKARAYKIEPAYEQLEFADCSVGCTSGVIKTSLAVGNINDLGFHPRGESIDLELFVLDNLNADILVGQDTIDILDVFNLHSESLIPSMPRLGESDINIIRHVGSLEKGVANLWDKVKRNLGGNPSGSPNGVTGGAEAQVDIDQRENARREYERARIAKLSDSDRQRAQELEDMAIQAFESERQRRRPRSNIFEGKYRCTFTGCTAPPFRTQYLLNSHADIHSTRSHYCSVKGCPRSEGGKGFIREYEMFRHVLAHSFPGYICPFCPDREHKYGRRDQLEWHVRIQHGDEDRGDPALPDVLAQRPDGPSRGRRRRGPPS